MPEPKAKPSSPSAPVAGPQKPPVRNRRRGRLFAAGLLLPFLAWAGLAVFVDQYGVVERAQKADAIVILGAGVLPGGFAGDSLTARTRHAGELYRNGLAPKVICTGGVGDHPPAESMVASHLAVIQGVRQEDLLREERSTSTRENARYAAELCRENGWQRVIVVSDPYHLFRAQRDFQREGLTAYPSPAKECKRHREWPRRVWFALRDAALLVRDVAWDLTGQRRA